MNRDRIGSIVAEGVTLGLVVAWMLAAIMSPG